MQKYKTQPLKSFIYHKVIIARAALPFIPFPVSLSCFQYSCNPPSANYKKAIHKKALQEDE
jgi:hypothetical protein